MMETLHPRSGFASQTSLHAGHAPPVTPPYTPAKFKRPFERSDSPASSIHPTETSSPAKKVLKRTASDNILVVELPDSDTEWLTCTDVVSPSELEEAEDYSSEIHSDNVEPDYESGSDFDSGISSRFSRLKCDEQDEQTEMAQKRLERRLSKRSSIRVFKRSHSQSANIETGVTDTNDVDERSGDISVRRLRRRVLSPVGGPTDWEEEMSSPEPGAFSPTQRGSSLKSTTPRTYASVLKGHEDDFAMGS